MGNKNHGMSKTPEYQAWAGMKNRCTNPKHHAYKYYGGRGISICDRWKESFPNFFKDMGKRPSGKHTLDRINNNGNYEKSNCRWATMYVQNHNNRAFRRMITFNGKTKCLSYWAKKAGLSFDGLTYRLNERGLPIEKALTEKSERWVSGTCKKGHKLSEDNIKIVMDCGRRKRLCKKCYAETTKRKYLRRCLLLKGGSK